MAGRRSSGGGAPPSHVRACMQGNAHVHARRRADFRGRALYLKPPMPVAMRSCSYDTQKTSCHGPRRSQPGTKPLYRASGPSLRTTLAQQSKVPLYGMVPSGSLACPMMRDLATSAGVEQSEATKPEQMAEARWHFRLSPV